MVEINSGKKCYKANTALALMIRDLMKEDGMTAELVPYDDEIFIETNASSNIFHSYVLRALCRKSSDEKGFPFITKSASVNQSILKDYVEKEGVAAFAISSPVLKERGRYKEADETFVIRTAQIIRERSSGLADKNGVLKIGLSREELIKEAVKYDISLLTPNPASTFVIDAEQAEKLTKLAMYEEVLSIAKWRLNSDDGEQMVIYKNEKRPIGRCVVSGSHMSKWFELTGITVLIEKDGSDSIKVVSSYPCLAGDDINEIRRDMKNWRNYYKYKRHY